MKRFLLALTLVACMGAVTACGGGAAQKKSVGIQLYSLHQDMGNVEASLQRLADIGYTSVETLNGNGANAGVIIDMLKYQEIVGSIAGDDTVFSLCKTAEDAETVRGRLERLAGN